jgi:hypothetical protein
LDDRATFGRFVGERRELRGLGERFRDDARRGDEVRRLAVAERDRPRLVEEEDVHVARGLDGSARHREDVVLEDAIHAGDPDRREQTADRRRDQADEEGDEHGRRGLSSRVEGERTERHRRDEEHDREPREEDRERDFVRRLLPLRPFDERDHAVDERLARVRRDLDDDPVGEDARPAGDRRTVAPRFADDGRRFSRDRRFVDGGDSLDDGAVSGDDLPGLHDDAVALAERRGRHGLLLVALSEPAGGHLALPAAERLRLRLAAPFRHRLREVREEEGEPEPERDLDVEEHLSATRDVAGEEARDEDGADEDDEHDRVLRLELRRELDERIPDRRPDDRRVEEAAFLRFRHVDLLRRAPRPSSRGARRAGRGKRPGRTSARRRSRSRRRGGTRRAGR